MADSPRRFLGAKSGVFSIIMPRLDRCKEYQRVAKLLRRLFAKNSAQKIDCVSCAGFFQQIGAVEFDGTRTERRIRCCAARPRNRKRQCPPDRAWPHRKHRNASPRTCRPRRGCQSCRAKKLARAGGLAVLIGRKSGPCGGFSGAACRRSSISPWETRLVFNKFPRQRSS
jgi:hypothetical protein